MSRDEVLSKKDQSRVDRIKDEICRYEKRIELLKRQIEEIKVGQSPIHPGDVIEWESGAKVRRGIVRSVSSCWDGFVYRCNIVSANGRHIGFANVNTAKMPILVDRSAAKKAKPRKEMPSQ